jgi:hypothetical protein
MIVKFRENVFLIYVIKCTGKALFERLVVGNLKSSMVLI